MNRIDDISSNLSVRLKRSYCARHFSDWQEKRTKIDYTLWNIMEGNVYIEVGGISYTAGEGDVIIFYPGTEYSASTDNDGCQFLYNRFNVKMGSGIDILASMRLDGIIPSRLIGSKCRSFCRQFMNVNSMAQKMPFKMYSIFISYLSDILEFTPNTERVSFPYTESKRAGADPNILRVMEYMDEHYTEPLPISLLADIAVMSEKYFISCFKKIAGISPGQYIIQLKMRKAAQLLLTSDMSVAEVSKAVGYANPYTFSNTFKKYYEESPMNFKNHSVF